LPFKSPKSNVAQNILQPWKNVGGAVCKSQGKVTLPCDIRLVNMAYQARQSIIIISDGWHHKSKFYL
jgi:hypothetical protein